jgi:ribonuclease P protein subunit RPR2
VADEPPAATAQEEIEAVRRQMIVFAREIREVFQQERQRSRELEGALEDLNEAYLATIKTLAFLVEAKDEGTRRHLDRTHAYGMALARIVAPDLAERPELGYGFLLHDIGKVGIPERILQKEDHLTDAEWAVMRTHPVVGAEIVAPMRFLGQAVEVIRYHHESFDGSGYPDGLAGKAIPIAARIFTVVDAFDAMTSDRPYRGRMRTEQAMGEIVEGSGSQFDPEIVEAFLILMEAGVPEPAPAEAPA